MIVLENKIVKINDINHYEYRAGYFLTLELLKKLVRDFQIDCVDSFVSNDETYIEQWLKNNKIE